MSKRRVKKSLKKLIDDASEAADRRAMTVGTPMMEELNDLVWHENEIVIFSPILVDLPGKVYKMMESGLKRRGFMIRKQREVELRKDRLTFVNRYLVEGEGVAEEAAIYAKFNNLEIVESY